MKKPLCHSRLAMLTGSLAALGIAFPASGLSSGAAPAGAARAPAQEVAPGPAAATFPTRFTWGRFGEVIVYAPATARAPASAPGSAPRAVTLLLSGDGGWNGKVDAMARNLVALGSMVVGVDTKRYLKALDASHETCVYTAADFENLSHEAQKRAALAEYHVPVLVGYSSGATLAYATLLQAPAGTFAGAMSLGFCPDLPIRRPVCRSNALVAHELPGGRGIALDPQPRLASPWIVLNGTEDRACPTAAARDFVNRTGGAKLVEVPEVGHGFAPEKRWVEHFRASWQSLESASAPQKTPAAAVSDLPLVELAPESGRAPLLAVMLTGDGGWAGIDQDLGAALSRRGLGVVGLSTLKYFWKARTPEEAAAALQRVIEHYAAAWRAERVLLVGYSFGADVLPFLYERLPGSTRSRVRALGLLGLGASADFEIHLADWLPGPGSARGLPTVPMVARIREIPILCVSGAGDSDSRCPVLTGANVTVREIGDGHHFGGQYERIAQELMGLIAPH